MMTTVRGYYNGTTFIFDEDIICDIGQEVLLTLVDKKPSAEKKKRQPIDFSQFYTPTERGENVEAYMREMRDNDRI